MTIMKLTSRGGLRAFLIAGAVFLGGFCGKARADLALTATFTGVTSAVSVGYTTTGGALSSSSTAGLYNWTGSGPGIAVIGSPFTTYCIELGQTISNGQSVNYTLTANVDQLPKTTGAMGANKAKQLGALALGIKSSVIAGTHAEIQTAIWHIVFETTANDWNVTTGNFKTNNPVANFQTDVNNILTYVKNNWSTYDPNTAAWNVLGITNDNSQDQVLFASHPQFLQTVPAPAGLVLAALGIVGIGGCNYLRRRKSVTGT